MLNFAAAIKTYGPMDLKTLRTFVTVADTESFSAAAGRLNITQSAVSRHIISLEDEIGIPLFIRKPHSVLLTEAGSELIDRAKKIIRDADDYIDHAKSMSGTVSGELRIGVGSFIEPYIRVSALRMMEKFPSVRLNVEFAKACRLNQMLREHKIDIAFTMNTARKDEGILSEPCIPFNIRAIMSDTHALSRKDVVTFNDLLRFSVIMPDAGERVFQTIQRYMDVDLSRLRVKAVVSSAYAAISALDVTKTITFLPELYLRERTGLVAKPIQGLTMDLMSNVHYMADTPLKRSAQEFISIVKEYGVPLIASMRK